MATIEVKVPPIGDFKDVPIIEVLVKPGDEVAADAPLVTLESEKATMDVPAPSAGKVSAVQVKVGDHVSEGSVVVTLETGAETGTGKEPPAKSGGPAKPGDRAAGDASATPTTAANQPRGTASATDQPQEPSEAKGPRAAPPPAEERPAPPAAGPGAPAEEQPAATGAPPPSPAPERPAGPPEGAPLPHASPVIRALARELGVDLARVEGTGPHRRILKEDVRRFVKQALAATPAPAGGAGLELAPWPKVDFARFGPVERQPLSRIRKLSKGHLARNWVMIPHVTQFDEADVTDLEAFRQELNREQEKAGTKVKVTLLAFLMKACVAALKRFPELNASLEGDELVLKRYYHLGFAADTPAGLVVPVLRDVDRKGLLEVAKELSELAAKARDGKLSPNDIQGGTFSISSLGGVGGTAFTPIINAPEVAILGVSRTATKPVWDGQTFAPRLVLPLSLSYDHRVIDGALAARITTFLAQILGDLRRAML
jgi:pyruvate dehydrogenase E2 component (dihydrolipoamide acetyltransferase)